MNSPSSITFNVGAPTFGVWFTLSSEGQLCCRFSGESNITPFPNWNGAPGHPPINLKTNAFEKPSSNTLNVGAPTFFVGVLRLTDSHVLAGLKPSGYKPLYVGAGLQPGRPSFSLAVSQ
jgi:hypothetical protein